MKTLIFVFVSIIFQVAFYIIYEAKNFTGKDLLLLYLGYLAGATMLYACGK